MAALTAAVIAMGSIAFELGDLLTGLDVNPLLVSATGVVAADVLVMSNHGGPAQKMA